MGSRTAALALTLLVAVGCDTSEEAPPLPSTSAAVQMRGDWKLALSPAQQAQLQVMALVLREPRPTEAELRAAELTLEQAQTAAMLLKELEADPNSPRITQLRATLGQMESARLHIGEGKLQMVLGADNTHEGQYQLVEIAGSVVQLDVTTADGRTERTAVELPTRDELIWGADAKEGDRMRFVRIGPQGG